VIVLIILELFTGFIVYSLINKCIPKGAGKLKRLSKTVISLISHIHDKQINIKTINKYIQLIY